VSDNVKFDPEKIKMLDFKLIKGQIDMPEEFDSAAIMDYDVENSLQMSFNLEQKLLKIDFHFTVKSISGEGNSVESTGQYHLVYIYHVSNMEELTRQEENKLLEIDSYLATAISAISFSTSRGILLTRMQGTAFQNFILPVVDPVKLLRS